MTDTQRLDLVRAREALDTIKTYALTYCTNPTRINQVDDAFKIATGISAIIEHNTETSILIAANLCEDVNYHEAAAYLTSL